MGRFKENELKAGKMHSGVLQHQLTFSHLLLSFLNAVLVGCSLFTCLGVWSCIALRHLASHS